MRINQLSKSSGVSSTTIRFYEKSGLLPKAVRGENGYREYPAERVEQLRMIAKVKDLGFTLKEVRELSEMLFTQKLSRKEMSWHLQKKNEEIDQRIKNLRKIKSEINKALQGKCEFKRHLR